MGVFMVPWKQMGVSPIKQTFAFQNIKTPFSGRGGTLDNGLSGLKVFDGIFGDVWFVDSFKPNRKLR